MSVSLPLARHHARADHAPATRAQLALTGAEWHALAAEAERRNIAPAVVLRAAIAEIVAAWSAGGDVEPASLIDGASLPVTFSTEGLRLSLQATADGIVAETECDEARFPAGLVPAMDEALVTLLRSLAADSAAWDARRRDHIPAEQRERRTLMNATARTWDGPLTLHGPFVEQARRTPDAPAVIAAAAGQLTYAELLARAGALATRLRDGGLAAGAPVAIAIDKSLDQVVAAMAVAMAGSPYVPVAPRLPAARRRLLIEQVGATHVLVAADAVRPADWPATVRLLTAVDGAAGHDFATVREDALGYVIFTSGSTGTPKGVMIEHRAAMNTVFEINRRFGVGARDRVLALSELSFDLSVYDIFGLLAAGGALVMPEPHETKNPAAWLAALERHEITIFNAVPALMQLLVAYAEARGARLPPSLRLVMLSGDWIPVDLPDRIRALAPHAEVVSLGGATEASIWSVAFPIGTVDPDWTSIPYGRPLANQTMYILRPDLTECPDWVPGDLYYGGLGLARGYWNDPERTAASFFIHPDSGERLYRSGDLGRHLPDGNIEFLGRADHQIKLNGYRIELGEIESTLNGHPDVADAVAAVRTDDSGNRRLVGFVTLRAEAAGGGADLRRFLAQQLPSHMVPSVVVTLPMIPLSSNGKVDRAALPDPWKSGASHRSESRP